MRNTNRKRLMLLVLCIALALGVSGCLIKPDKTVEDQPDSVQVLPFATATPVPTAAPTIPGDGQSGWQGTQATIPPQTIVTAAPTVAPTAPIITLAPTAPPRTAAPTTAPTARPTASDSTLRVGSDGQAVRNLQQKLKDLGYYSGSVDGDFGSGTEDAVKAFQKANGLSADGVAGSRTLSQINSSNAKPKPTANTAYATSRPTPKTYTPSTPNKYRYLQLGSSGSDVKRLQERLRELGYFYGSVNGKFGADTEAAVIAFQSRNGQWADGVAGEDTQNALYSSSALANKKSEALPSNVTYTYRTLRTGMTGDDVGTLQARLKELYYFDKAVDNTYGSTTELAVRVFQQRNGMTVDGVAGSGTQERLYGSLALSAPTAMPTQAPFKPAGGTLKLGSTGEEVFRLQERLFDLGYYTGRIDGTYSAAVETAVRAFQSANKLSVDGKAGSGTQTRIFSVDAKAASGADDTMASLRQGDTGERVRALQALLTNYGYYVGTIDGNYTGDTTTAVQQFQAQNGLFVDGIAGPATQQLLYNGTPKRAAANIQPDITPQPVYETLKQGMSGPNVMMMQQYLKDNGFYFSEVDGTFGATTYVAVQAFQAQNGLKTDGVAGSETLAMLYALESTAADGVTNQWENAGRTAVVRTSMKDGDQGQDVFDLQARLGVLGYYSGAPTGIFDAATKEAVQAFQKSNSLTADGIAGEGTMVTMYGAGVIPAEAKPLSQGAFDQITNRARELEEQNQSGAISASVAGGGIAASSGNNVYYVGGRNGSLYMSSGGKETQLYESPARFIHANDKGVTFVSGSQIMRVPLGGGRAEKLGQVGSVDKFTMVGEGMYYLEGDSLIKMSQKGDTLVLTSNIYDFTVDVYDYKAYTASAEGIRSIGLNGSGETLLSSTPANQVQLCDSVVFYRSGGAIYRIDGGISVLLLEADASWMGIYRDKLYYITADRLYRCDTNGQNHEAFYDNMTSDVSFVSGKVYISRDPGGPITQVLPID